MLYGEWPERAGSKEALRKLLCGLGEQGEGSDPGRRSKGDERSIGLGINFEKAKETW